MRTAHAAGVTRVILTSSVAAIIDTHHRGIMDETNWCNPDAADTSAYSKSKTLAERAAWDFTAQNGMALTTINPGFVMGPPLDHNFGSSVAVIARMLRGKDPMVPMIGFPVVDVRDVAEAHLRALTRPDSAGKRFPCVSSVMTMPDMARVLKQAYPARRIATRVAPLFLLRFLPLFDAQIRATLPIIGQIHAVSNTRAHTDLDMRFISGEGSLRATAEWLIANNAV
jgi:dihydroflavonol-4-reductase